VGVEMLEARHEAALAALRNAPAGVRDLVEFRLEDACLSPIASATHIFICNTCFPWELNAAVASALSPARAPRLVRVATTIRLPEDSARMVQLRLVKVTSIEVAWSMEGCALYLYERSRGDAPTAPVVIDSAAEQMSQRRVTYARQLVDRPSDFGETAASAERVLLRSSMFAASLAFMSGQQG